MNCLPEIAVSGCKLAKITSMDVKHIRKIAENEAFKTYMPELYELLKTEEGCHAFWASFVKQEQEGCGYLWGIKNQSMLIGFVGIMDIPDNSTIFYAMHPMYRCKGYAKECVRTVVLWYNNHFSGYPLYTEIDVENKASLHIASLFPSIMVNSRKRE